MLLQRKDLKCINSKVLSSTNCYLQHAVLIPILVIAALFTTPELKGKVHRKSTIVACSLILLNCLVEL